jgi:hypothetical protein
MAKICVETVLALRNTALHIENSHNYQWGHMGSCNCGFLAQEICRMDRHQIHSRAMERTGDWSEQLKDYCPSSGLSMDDLIATMLAFGFSPDDLRHLERLSDPKVLRSFPENQRHPKHNVKADVVKYLRQWANSLEAELIDQITLDGDSTNLFHAAAEDNITNNLLAHYPG